MNTPQKTPPPWTQGEAALLAHKVARLEPGACTCRQVGVARGCLTCQFWSLRIGLADLAAQIQDEIGTPSGLEVSHG